MTIKSLAQTPANEVIGAFQAAFADYDISIDRHQLQAMLRRRGFRPELSMAAFDTDGHIAAFTFNGIGRFNGRPTAYDTGTGTLPQYRGQGLAARIFEHSLPELRQAGIEQYLLEVLTHNAPAIKIYSGQGFKTRRTFDCFRLTDRTSLASTLPPEGIEIRDVEPGAIEELQAMDEFEASWQNSFDSIVRAGATMRTVAAFDGSGCRVGYGVIEPASGDITRIAVASPWRRRGIGSALLARLSELSAVEGLKAVNTDSRCSSIKGFFEAKGFDLHCTQYEMIRPL